MPKIPIGPPPFADTPAGTGARRIVLSQAIQSKREHPSNLGPLRSDTHKA